MGSADDNGPVLLTQANDAEMQALRDVGVDGVDVLDYPAYIALMTRQKHLARSFGTALACDPTVCRLSAPHPAARQSDGADV